LTSDQSLLDVYIQAAGAIAFVSVIDKQTNDMGIGTAFHVGKGIFVTAKHVIEGKDIVEVATTKRAIKKEFQGKITEASASYSSPKKFEVKDGPHHAINEKSDIALFQVNLNGEDLPKLQLDALTNYFIDDNTYLLEDVLVIGYPPIPCSNFPIQVATRATVNAVVNVRQSEAPHFIVSALARGGFSGGPVISTNGQVIGIVTESLILNGAPAESGFMSVLSIETVIDELKQHYEFDLIENNIWRLEDGFVLHAVKFNSPNSTTNELNPRLHDTEIHIYDDGRDLYGQIECEDPDVLSKSIEAFMKVCQINKLEDYSSPTLCAFIPDNVSEKILLDASIASKNVFLDHGYTVINHIKRSI